MTADVRLADVACTLDGLAAFEQFRRLDMLYAAHLRAAEGPPDAGDRRVLLRIVRRMLALVEPADLFLQDCDERIKEAKGPEFDQRLEDLLSSEPFAGAFGARVSPEDLPTLVAAGPRRSREMLAEQRDLLAVELKQLEAGRRPERMSSVEASASEYLAGAAMAGAGMAMAAGALVATTAAAPKAAVAALLVGGAVLEGAAIAILVHAAS